MSIDNERATMGRPQVGPMINFRLSERDLAAVDDAAAARDLTRAAWLRECVARRLPVPSEEQRLPAYYKDLPGFMRWMLLNDFDTEDLINMVEEPHNYELEYLIFETGYEADIDEVHHRDDVETQLLIDQLRAQLSTQKRSA